MIKSTLRLITSGVLVVFTVLTVLAARLLPGFFFSFYPAFSRWAVGALSTLTSVVPFALCEILLFGLLLWFVASLIAAIVRRRMVRWLTGLLLLVCVLGAAFVNLWGLNYFAPKMQTRMELPIKQYTTAQLRQATEYYLQMANQTAPLVERDENGKMLPQDFSALAEQAGEGYETLAKRFPCFDGVTVRVKPLLLGKLSVSAGSTGVFICLTGESCVSKLTYTASLPFTMCHEIGHRMAFAREDEANFAGYLACEVSSYPAFRYSGYYNAFVYCYNALNEVDATAAAEVMSACGAELAADLNAAVAHYDELHDETLSAAGDKVYDTYLKTFSVQSGVQSYGEVTDLLLTWYFEELQ